jgi:hypothetical protein
MSESYSNLTIAILSKQNLSVHPVAERFLSTLIQFPLFVPQLCGSCEPVQISFAGIKQTLGEWEDPFLWKNNESSFEGSAWSGRGTQHSAIYVHGPLRHFDLAESVRFLTSCAEVLDADFGYLHLTTHQELHGALVPYRIAYPMDIGVSAHDLRKGIPNLGWVSVLGPPYQPLINPRLCSQEFELIQLNPARSLLRLNTSAEQIMHDFANFNCTRESAKNQIGPDLFWAVDASRASRVPSFNFKPS